MELVPLKVTIRLQPREGNRGRFKYPNFDDLAASLREDMRWQDYFDKYGGWLYDRAADHSTDSPDSPFGVWHGVVTVPETFADAAEEAFPDDCEVIDEADFEKFYDDRVMADAPEFVTNSDVINAIRARQDAGLTLEQSELDALDPDKNTPGVVRNARKRWGSEKARRGVKVKRKPRHNKKG